MCDEEAEGVGESVEEEDAGFGGGQLGENVGEEGVGGRTKWVPWWRRYVERQGIYAYVGVRGVWYIGLSVGFN